MLLEFSDTQVKVREVCLGNTEVQLTEKVLKLMQFGLSGLFQARKVSCYTGCYLACKSQLILYKDKVTGSRTSSKVSTDMSQVWKMSRVDQTERHRYSFTTAVSKTPWQRALGKRVFKREKNVL